MKKVIMILSTLLFLAGLAVLLYPMFRTTAFRQAEKETICRFEQYRETVPSPTGEEPADEEAEKAMAFPELRDACAAYNEALKTRQQTSFTAQAWEQPPICLSDYGWEQEVFGYISIPSAEIEAPIYLGGSMANLNQGAAILGQTSMPIGGEGTHCVIAGHRTWNAILHPFVGLEKVQPGDLVCLTNPWETLTYRVTEVEIIFPDDSEKILIRKGRDLLSVFTCTYPNTRRVLVTCERIQKEET